MADELPADFEVFVDTAPTRIVRQAQPYTGNPLAIAALVVGILAALTCWVPVLGVASVPVSAVAVLLGIPGLIIALPRNRTGFAAAAMGLALAIGSFFVARHQAERVNRALEQLQKDLIRSARSMGPAEAPERPAAQIAP